MAESTNANEQRKSISKGIDFIRSSYQICSRADWTHFETPQVVRNKNTWKTIKYWTGKIWQWAWRPNLEHFFLCLFEVSTTKRQMLVDTKAQLAASLPTKNVENSSIFFFSTFREIFIFLVRHSMCAVYTFALVCWYSLEVNIGVRKQNVFFVPFDEFSTNECTQTLYRLASKRVFVCGWCAFRANVVMDDKRNCSSHKVYYRMLFAAITYYVAVSTIQSAMHQTMSI